MFSFGACQLAFDYCSCLGFFQVRWASLQDMPLEIHSLVLKFTNLIHEAVLLCHHRFSGTDWCVPLAAWSTVLILRMMFEWIPGMNQFSGQFRSFAQSCPTLWDPMDCSPCSPSTRVLCPSPTARVYSNSCPLSLWCHPTISSSVVPFSSFPQSFPASGSFPRSQFFPSGGQSTRVSASASVLPINVEDWFPLGLASLISLQSKGLSRVFLQHHSSKASILQCSAFFIFQISHLYMTTGKTIALTRWTFAGKMMSLLFNMLARLVKAFLPRGKCLLISWLQSPSAGI